MDIPGVPKQVITLRLAGEELAQALNAIADVHWYLSAYEPKVCKMALVAFVTTGTIYRSHAVLVLHRPGFLRWFDDMDSSARWRVGQEAEEALRTPIPHRVEETELLVLQTDEQECAIVCTSASLYLLERKEEADGSV